MRGVGLVGVLVVVVVVLVVAVIVPADDTAGATASPGVVAPACACPALHWFDPALSAPDAVGGRAWPTNETGSPYVRLPLRAQGAVPLAVWDLSRDTAGLFVGFETTADAIYVSVALRSATLAMPHMSAVGASGVDLFVLDDEGNSGRGGEMRAPQQPRWRWAASSANYWGPQSQNTTCAPLLVGAPARRRAFRLYLPLYNGVDRLGIGVPRTSGADFEFVPASSAPPIVFWGTSILQGAVAARPGMAYASILARWLGHPVVNLGFSGNGKMQASVARFVAEIHARAFVIQCLPNMNASEVAERTGPTVLALRASQPDTPILLVEGHTDEGAWIRPDVAREQAAKRVALRAAFDKLVASGVRLLTYVKGADLVDEEDTVDGVHLSDLGMVAEARALLKHLQHIVRAHA